MDRHALHLHAEPQHACIGAHQLVILGFGDHRSIGSVAAQQGGQRAVAGAFLLDNRLLIQRDGGAKAQPRQRIDGKHVGGDPGLHIGHAAAIHPVARASGGKGRRGPHLVRAFGDHVDMPVQHQRPALFLFRSQRAHDVLGVGIIHNHWGEARMVGDIVHVDRPTVHGIAACLQFAEQKILCDALLSAQAGMARERFSKDKLILKSSLDGIEYGLGQIRGQGHRLSAPESRSGRRPAMWSDPPSGNRPPAPARWAARRRRSSRRRGGARPMTFSCPSRDRFHERPAPG